MPLTLWAGRSPSATVSPGLEGWDAGFFDMAAAAGARHRSIEPCLAVRPRVRGPAVTVMAFQWPNGTRDPAAFSTRRPPIAACHLGVGGGLVGGHEAVRVEIELALEPGQARRLHVLLLRGAAGAFWRAMPRRLKERDRLLTPTRGPVRPGGRAAHAGTARPAPRRRASVDRRPSARPASAPPARRSRASARHESPASIAAATRSRRSTDRAGAIGYPPRTAARRTTLPSEPKPRAAGSDRCLLQPLRSVPCRSP